MSKEPLQLLPFEKWSELQCVFKKDWPRSISGYTVLETQRYLKEKGFDYGFKVYCPFGDVWNGMVALNEKDQFYEIIIQCARDDTQKLEEALRRTNIIDWDRPIIVPFAPYHVIECVRKAVGDYMNLRLLPSEKFVYENAKVFEDVNLPPNIVFGQLTPNHVNLLDSTWPHRYRNSSSYFELLINSKCGYGLFLESNLIAWVLYNESGTLLHLFTVEEHRKKGIAELLLKMVSNILVEQGKPVSAYCLKDNLNACNLYKKVGFAKSNPVAWCYLNKK